MKEDITSRIAENIDRVDSLVNMYESLHGQGRGRRDAKKTDILRAAVVLLHASLEDFLRSLVLWKLPKSESAEALNAIPFAGSGNKRPEKVFLGYLVRHKGKRVDALISESVEQYSQRSNYNNTVDVAATLESIEIDPKTAEIHFAILDEMMSRRHRIVHRADRDDTGGSGRHKVNSISVNRVNDWINAVAEFSMDVLEEL